MTKPLGDAAQAPAHALYSNLALAEYYVSVYDRIKNQETRASRFRFRRKGSRRVVWAGDRPTFGGYLLPRRRNCKVREREGIREAQPASPLRWLQVHAMQKKARKQNLSGDDLTVAVAQNVFGWKQVHEHKGELIGKKQDNAGRWRTAKVPNYANDPHQASAIEERMEQLGRSARYLKERSKRLLKSKTFPANGRHRSKKVEQRSKPSRENGAGRQFRRKRSPRFFVMDK